MQRLLLRRGDTGLGMGYLPKVVRVAKLIGEASRRGECKCQEVCQTGYQVVNPTCRDHEDVKRAGSTAVQFEWCIVVELVGPAVEPAGEQGCELSLRG